MAAHIASSIRHLAHRPLPLLRGHQRRWAQVHDVRFLATHQSQDRVLEKYRSKLDRKASQEGHHNIDSLKDAYKDKIAELRKKAAVPGATAPPDTNNMRSKSVYGQPPPPPPQAAELAPEISKNDLNTKGQPGVKTLSSFLDVEKTRGLPAKEIETIWRLRHASNPNSLCATIPLHTYETISHTARRHPQFILPLPREGQGAEIHFLQWTWPSPTTSTVLFTHLAEYKLRGEFSQPHTTVTHHLDLADDKGVVLLQGQVVDGKGVSTDEAKWLLMCLQKFYSSQAEETPRRRLMDRFSRGDGEGFKVEELLEEAEKIG
ncbi:MAG: hypothetical protein M1820_006729 [Bogoriella megaspora]|nr:MAG: hypothetical protein M1820_006729 [Bogoriella megaspora]